ncbi:hypothetical protein ACN38_g4207 [Penicillium nordicum]|uniref:Uncharacterized protein n=1 Tax=Penicillium nordicum TaxID=229535 RepID=A0A0M9WHB1_9EURO|nr:hypothetical protein ACN38_g4207 [Penicillium nordicum]
MLGEFGISPELSEEIEAVGEGGGEAATNKLDPSISYSEGGHHITSRVLAEEDELDHVVDLELVQVNTLLSLSSPSVVPLFSLFLSSFVVLTCMD